MHTNFYPKSPSGLSLNFTTPNKSYKKHIFIASIVLILFMLLYISLSAFFLYKSYRLFATISSRNDNVLLSFMTAFIFGFLGIFMIKALFFKSKWNKSNNIEIKEKDEPLLFDFIYKVADEAKAPRPHKIFLSTIVNASVFYDVSFINLIFPTRKNLEIGIGLVNVLNVGEFKSVLAHEFGHFTQRSMIIGRWVYIANKIASQIISKRDRLDAFLNGLSRSDIRIAWIGWLLSIIVWSIRSVSESFFKLVLLTQRALSREMEFHADLVAVSLSGSDAIVHSLYKLHNADEAYREAIDFVNRQLKNNKSVPDVYAIQSNFIKNMAVALNNPTFGIPPRSEDRDPSKFSVFKEQIAQAPLMWSTHPSNIDREKNAKRVYVQSELNEQSSWCLFKNADETKNKLTLTLYKDLKIETTALTKEESIAQYDQEFQRSFLLPKYRGVYLNRDILTPFKSIRDIYNLSINSHSAANQISLLYPQTLQGELEHLKNLNEEIEMLEGLHNKVLDANKGKINYRNRLISRKDLPDAIDQAKKEAKNVNSKIIEHDKLCRNIPFAIANEIGKGWKEYLISITTLVHYCEHTQKIIESKKNFFYDTLAQVSKIRNVNNTEMLPLLRAASELRTAMEGVFTYGKSIKLSYRIVEKLGGKQFEDLLEPFELNEATRENINSWISVVSSWIDFTWKVLQTVKEGALDELLFTETFLENVNQSVENIDQAPTPVLISEVYASFNSDEQKEVAVKPDFISKIYHAHGTLPSISRLVIAGSIILFAVFFSGTLSNSTVIVYNGLPINVLIKIGDHSTTIDANESSEIEINDVSDLDIKTTTATGEVIESFKPEKLENSRTYLYNIANAAIIYEWYAVYGGSGPANNEPRLLGAPRWTETTADYYFKDPPQSIQLSAGRSETKTILSAYPPSPYNAALITDKDDLINFISQHALREKSNSSQILYWFAIATDLKTFPDILKKRLALDPLEIISLRAQQELAKGTDKQKNCEQYNQLYVKHPENPDLYYIKVRCLQDGPQQDSAFLNGYKKWPDNGWLAYASSFFYLQNEEWEKAVSCLNIVRIKKPELAQSVAEDLKRIYHLLKKDSMMVELKDISSTYLQYVISVENSSENDPQNRFYAFKLLDKGQIQEALDYSKQDTNLYGTILLLAAVSDNVSDAIVNKAVSGFSLDKAINNNVLFPLLALLSKKNLPIDPYKEPLKNMLGNNVDSVLKFIAAVKSNKIAEADKLLMGMPVEMKAKTSLLGVLLLGNTAPKKWNLYASELLFINERPYRKHDLSS